MKKKLLILAAVAVSGVAAVVAGNTNKFFNSDAEAANYTEHFSYGRWIYCLQQYEGTCAWYDSSTGAKLSDTGYGTTQLMN